MHFRVIDQRNKPGAIVDSTYVNVLMAPGFEGGIAVVSRLPGRLPDAKNLYESDAHFKPVVACQ